MTNITAIVEAISLFNNRSFTKKQWELILKGCGCPKSPHLWTAFKNICLTPESALLTLLDFDSKSFNEVWNQYCTINREYANKSYAKSKAKKKAQERSKAFQGLVFYEVNGCLTTENPNQDMY